MANRRLIILLLSFFIFTLHAQEVEKQPVSLIPYPVTIEEGEGHFVFTEKTVLAYEDEEMETIVKDFASLFSKAAGFTPKTKKSKKGDVCIKKDGNLLEEAYVLEVNTEKIWIKAAGNKEGTEKVPP